MKIRCGTDIIEISRIRESIEELKNKFTDKIYTTSEKKYCESKKSAKYQHYAARFAAKEAVFKAISQELNDKYSITWKDIEITNDNQGRPIVNIITELKDIEIHDIDISLSHCREYAIANVIVCIK